MRDDIYVIRYGLHLGAVPGLISFFRMRGLRGDAWNVRRDFGVRRSVRAVFKDHAAGRGLKPMRPRRIATHPSARFLRFGKAFRCLSAVSLDPVRVMYIR